MTGVLSLLWLFMLILFASWILSQLMVPTVLRAIDAAGTSPGIIRRRLFMTAILPWLLPLVAVIALAVIAAGKYFGFLHDHCHYHAPHHPHFCFEHLPQMLLGYPHALLGGILAGLVLALFVRFLRHERDQIHRIGALTTLASGKGMLKRVDDKRVFAFAAGLRQPRIFFSIGLERTLNNHERRIVLAHEVAHIRRRDLWWNVVIECLLILSVAPLAKVIRQRWNLAMEAQVDDHVAQRYGTTQTAAVLVKLARMAAPTPAPASITGSELTLRVERLLNRGPMTRNSWVFDGLFWAANVGFVAILMNSHHSLETLLGYLVG